MVPGSVSPWRQVPTFSHTLRGAWCSPPLSLWEFRGGKTRSSSAYPTARKSVSFLLLSQFPHVCLPGSNVSELMFPVFVGLCFKEKNIFFYLGFWKDQNYVWQFNQQSFSFAFHEFLETRSFQESKFPRIQVSNLDLNCSCIFADNSCLEVYSSALCFYPSVYWSISPWMVVVVAFTHGFFVTPTSPSSVVLATHRSVRVCFVGK